MTHISIVAAGSRGDVQPYVALGYGLKQAGYSVRVLATEDFETLVTEAGLDFSSTGESIEAITQSAEWRQTLESGNFLTILAKMQRESKVRGGALAHRLPPLLEGADLIITGAGGMGGVFTWAEAHNVPVIQAYIFPFTPTRAYPAPLVPNLPLGRAFNRLSFHVMRQMMWQNSKTSEVVMRQLLGLNKGSFWGPFRSLNQRRVPALYGFSQHVLPRPQDWPQNYHVTGYWFLDEPEQWTPPADLVAFLDAGAPPVYIGFGSMGSRSPEDAGALALEALERAGQRGVLASGWGGLKASNVPDSVHLISSIPHAWLFPHMAAVVHHGGAGTTAAGLRAGVPSVIIPMMGDQPFWGQRVADLGAGTAPVARKRLTAERLAANITEAVTNTVMRQRARELGEKVRAEGGIANAVAFVERFLQQAYASDRALL